MRKRSTEIYLSKKEILLFFKATNSDIDYLIKKGYLKYSAQGGGKMFSLSDVLDATFHLTKWARKQKKK